MIIFGTRGVTMTRESGEFYCPSCGGQQEYRHRTVRRFFTLYFIPIIPMDLLGEYIECSACGGAYELEVLSIDHRAVEAQVQAEFNEDLKRVLVLMMLADGTVEDIEIQTIQNFLQQTGGQVPTAEEMSQDISMAQAANTTAAQYVGSIAPQLGDFGKELVIKGCFLVASATGTLRDPQRLQLEQLPGALGVSQDDFRRIVAEVSG